MAAVLPLAAQKGHGSERLFDKRFTKHPQAVEVLIKGSELRPYNLTLFRSLTLSGDAEAIAELERIVMEERNEALDKEEGMLSGRLYYGFYCQGRTGKEGFRYLFYRNASLKKEHTRNEVTIVYMEGNATLEELKRMFQ
ncbi:MAG: hypothetical protein IJ511_02565 [Bacteroides sp.]|nr:hypothetical protein [Bacteroides sp.]